MLKLNKYQLNRLKELTKDIKTKKEMETEQAIKDRYAAMSKEELEAEFNAKMSEHHEPIIINGKDIYTMSSEELAIAFSDEMRKHLN
ncbi:hypothetical protein [Pleurocapsa sp. FMAR1]|uniref:hypothetical protein n=1 Tax=Pleurocapsa sp. FMAR1 TaxID=3040204 RepID=UPI0029C93083|nr:hypothetical protein [Pleurocapsa sp. FMAR1]